MVAISYLPITSFELVDLATWYLGVTLIKCNGVQQLPEIKLIPGSITQ